MKKCLFIIFLIIINFTILYSKIYSSDLKNIKLKLDKNELAIILIYLENSTSLLLKNNDNFILYVLDYKNDTDFYINISLFTDKVDYVFMNEEYDLKYPYKVVLDESIILDGLRIEQNRIYYNNTMFCINEARNCDYVYLTNEVELDNEPKIIIYSDLLSTKYVNKLHDSWTDTYKMSKKEFIILILGNDYEVIKLQHEY